MGRISPHGTAMKSNAVRHKRFLMQCAEALPNTAQRNPAQARLGLPILVQTNPIQPTNPYPKPPLCKPTQSSLLPQLTPPHPTPTRLGPAQPNPPHPNTIRHPVPPSQWLCPSSFCPTIQPCATRAVPHRVPPTFIAPTIIIRFVLRSASLLLVSKSSSSSQQAPLLLSSLP